MNLQLIWRVYIVWNKEIQIKVKFLKILTIFIYDPTVQSKSEVFVLNLNIH